MINLKKSGLKEIFYLILFFSFVSCLKKEVRGKNDNPNNIEFREGNLFVNNKRFIIKGLNYDPVLRCDDYNSFNYEALLEGDAKSLREMNVNTIRVYTPHKKLEYFPESDIYEEWIGKKILDGLSYEDVKIIITMESSFSDNIPLEDLVKEYSSHPAVLMFAIGNEINQNFYYTKEPNLEPIPNSITLLSVVKQVKKTIRRIKKLTSIPVLVSWGIINEKYKKEFLYLIGEDDGNNDSLDDPDVISYQIYDNLKLDNVFERHSKISKIPFFISEYGADAWNSKTDRLDEASQAYGNEVLTKLIQKNVKEGLGIGALLFSYIDGLWKMQAGDKCKQESMGISAKESGPYPDYVFNEEYWGFFDIDRKPRKTVEVIKELFKEKWY